MKIFKKAEEIVGTRHHSRQRRPPDAQDVTRLLRDWSEGQEAALDQLIPLVEAELRQVARVYMRGERKGHTLQATALVNEVFLRLSGARRLDWQDRGHFVAIAARLMRRVLVDHARARHSRKRGGSAQRVSFDDVYAAPAVAPELDLVALDRALEAFAVLDQRKSRVVELRFFGGLSVEETATALHVSPDTIKRDWRLAKMWLRRELLARPLSNRRDDA